MKWAPCLWHIAAYFFFFACCRDNRTLAAVRPTYDGASVWLIVVSMKPFLSLDTSMFRTAAAHHDLSSGRTLRSSPGTGGEGHQAWRCASSIA